jgi:hypothetical protein
MRDAGEGADIVGGNGDEHDQDRPAIACAPASLNAIREGEREIAHLRLNVEISWTTAHMILEVPKTRLHHSLRGGKAESTPLVCRRAQPRDEDGADLTEGTENVTTLTAAHLGIVTQAPDDFQRAGLAFVADQHRGSPT